LSSDLGLFLPTFLVLVFGRDDDGECGDEPTERGREGGRGEWTDDAAAVVAVCAGEDDGGE